MKTQLTRHRLILTTLAVLTAGALLSLTSHRTLMVHAGAVPVPPSATLTVSSTADSGLGSLPV